MRKGKEFIFPENVSKEYSLWKDYTLKDFGIIIITLLICIIFIFLPPFNIYFILAKVILTTIVMTVVLAVLTLRPVKSRKNITQLQHFRMKKKYDKSQKLYFLAEKRRDRIYENIKQKN